MITGRTAPAAPARRPRHKSLGRRMVEHRWHYLFLLPMAVLFALFTAWPMIASWYYSFFDWDGLGPAEDFIGLRNYTEVLTSPRFWNAFKNSFLFSLVAIFVQLPLTLVFAIILNSPRLRGRNLYRLLLFLPVVTTTAVVGIVFAVLLDPSGGVVNEVLRSVGLIEEPINFLGSEQTALPTVLIIDLWKGFGITLIYWLAALQTIPAEIYEAARVDGAGSGRVLTQITVPMLVPIGIVILLLTFQSSMNPFDLIQATTKAGPNYATDVVSSYIYRYAFDPEMAAPRYGFACAAGVVFGMFTLVLTLIQAPLLRRRYTKGVA